MMNMGITGIMKQALFGIGIGQFHTVFAKEIDSTGFAGSGSSLTKATGNVVLIICHFNPVPTYTVGGIKIKDMNDRLIEQEANLFACLLLMPSECFKKDMENGIDLFDKCFVKRISDKYQVPENAALFRIMYYVQHKY